MVYRARNAEGEPNPLGDETHSYYDKLLQDIFLMMDFARKTGIPLPDSLQRDIAVLLTSKPTGEPTSNNEDLPMGPAEKPTFPENSNLG
jgi:hypothetical protein